MFAKMYSAVSFSSFSLIDMQPVCMLAGYGEVATGVCFLQQQVCVIRS